MFSKTTEYALRATLYITQTTKVDELVSLEDIAAAIGSPRSFTAKIMQDLTRNNILVTSARGPNGGFSLSEKSRQKPAKVILDIMGEFELLKKCVIGLSKCSETQPCPLHYEYKAIRQQLTSLFHDNTIQELAGKIGKDKVVINIEERVKRK